jgi:redox-sensitive bicupin YhaK (pirin superfamily)
MIERILADQHYRFHNTWLEADWHFSFQRYFDPNRMHFGALRAYNHDHIAPGRGFPLHPHREMEIITWVRQGVLTHEDSLGEKFEAGPGDLLVLTAGTGIEHAEMNYGQEPVELIQVWILPETEHVAPALQRLHLSPDDGRNAWLVAVAGPNLGGRLTARQDVRLAIARLDAGCRVEWEGRARHPLYVQCLTGAGTLNDVALKERDVAQIRHEPVLTLEAESPGEWLLVEVPEL